MDTETLFKRRHLEKNSEFKDIYLAIPIKKQVHYFGLLEDTSTVNDLVAQFEKEVSLPSCNIKLDDVAVYAHKHGGNMAGYCSVETGRNNSWTINDFFVNRKYRHHELAQPGVESLYEKKYLSDLLMETVEHYARRSRVRSIIAWVLDDRPKAVRFYERNCFKSAEDRRGNTIKNQGYPKYILRM